MKTEIWVKVTIRGECQKPVARNEWMKMKAFKEKKEWMREALDGAATSAAVCSCSLITTSKMKVAKAANWAALIAAPRAEMAAAAACSRCPPCVTGIMSCCRHILHIWLYSLSLSLFFDAVYFSVNVIVKYALSWQRVSDIPHRLTPPPVIFLSNF